MTLARFVHVADNHLGRRQYGLVEREVDFAEAFEEFVEKTLRLRPDFVVHSGDLFDSHRPYPHVMLEAYRGLKKLAEAGIRIYCVAGNHDLGPRPGGGRTSQLPLLSEALGGMFVDLGYHRATAEEGDLLIAGLPYTPRQEVGELRAALRKLGEKRRESGRRSVLILHQAVAMDHVVPRFKAELELRDVSALGFDYSALGHVHNRTVPREGILRRPVIYAGSTEIVEESEASDAKIVGKGFFLVEMEDDGAVRVTPHEIESVRPFISVSATVRSKADLDAVRERLRSELEEVRGRKRPLVRLRLRCEGIPAAEIRDFERELEGEFGDLALRISVAAERAREETVGEVVSSVSPEDLLGELLEGDAAELAREIYRVASEGKRRGDLQAEIDRWFERWAR